MVPNRSGLLSSHAQHERASRSSSLNASVLPRTGPGTLRLVLLSMVLAAASGAAAQDRLATARLAYEAPETCPDAEAFTGRVEARLGRAPFGEGAASTARVEVAAGIPHRGTLSWIDERGAVRGERTLVARHCDELVETLAVALAMLLEDPPRPPDAPRDPEAQHAAPPPPARPSPPLIPAPAATPAAERPDRPLRLELAADARGSLGFTPGPALGGGARVSIGTAMLSAHAVAAIAIQPGRASLRSRDSVDAFHARFGIGGCVRPERLHLCVEAGGGLFQAKVHSVDAPESRTSPSAFVSIRAGVPLRLTSVVSVEPFAAASILVLRPALNVNGETVWEASVVAGELGFALSASVE